MLATCPTQDQLKSLTLGQLPEEQSDVLLLHLAGCQTCQDEISQIDESDDTFVRQIKSASELPDSDQPDEFETEKGCRVAVTRALAALAKSEEEGGQSNIPNVPDSIGEYDILRPLGAGGMGHVYLGQHTKLGRPVAIKFIADHRRWDRTMHERFESEMRTIGGLKHPNIVVAHDAREVDGLAVLVTEFIDGMTVGEILKRTGKLETADACKIAGAVCKALSYIDSQGIVHRDIKPSNIMIDADGSVKLLDLGLARLQAGNEMTGSPEFTATGQAMGTADYVAPEQVNDSRNVDIRADLYGLGCTLYKMLSGQAPFAGKHLTAFAKMNAHVSEVPESLGDKGVPTELANLVDKMLEKNPEDRVQSPDVVLSQVEKHSKNANLTALVAVARTMPELKPGSLADAPETSAPARPKAGGSFFTRYPWTTAIAGGLAAFALGVLFGIIITVKNLNGTTAQVNIPDGSIAIIDEQGNIEIQLSDSDRKLNIPNAQVENRQKDLPIANNIPTKPIPASSDIESDLLGGLLGSAAPSTATPADAIGVKNWFGAKDRPAQPSTTYLRQRDRIRRVEGYLEWTEWIRITSDSPVFGKVEQGDMVDVLTVSNGSDDGLTLPQILYSNRPVYDVKPSGQDFVISLNGRVKIPGNSASTVKVIVDFHDPERQARLDAVKLNGVWRTVLTRVGEKILEHDEKAMLILNNRAVSFYGGNAQSHRFKIENREGRNYFEIDGYRNLYRFLENGRLEVFSNPSGGRDTKTMVRYERVTEPVSETEKNAFEIIALNKQVANTFECYIVEDDDENKQEVPTGSKRLPFDGKEILLVGKPVITNQHVASAKVEADERGQPSLIIEMTGEGAARMGMATRRHLRKKMAIVIDGKVEMAPVINAVIYSSLELSGDFEAEEFANLRKAIVPKLRFPEGLGRYFHREQSQENIRTLMLAIHNYESAHKVFPLSSNITEKGGYPYSWRVALLPFLDRHDLFDQYDFKSPWDSEKNKKVLVQMPDVFRHPSFPIGSTTTNYVGISGGQGALGPKKENAKADNKGMGGMDDYGDGMGMMDGMGGMSGYGAESEVEKSLQQLRNTGFADVIDGSSNTVFLIESKANIPWTKPEDFPIESLLKEGKPDYQAIVKLRFLDESGLGVGFGDGVARVLDYAKIIPASKSDHKRLSTLYQLFNVADGSTINPESLTINELKPKMKNK